MENPTTFFSLLLITVLAALVPVLSVVFRKVRLPIVVGEILVGVLIGHSGLNLIQESPTLTFLAEFGFVFLMFLSGLEVDFSALRRTGRHGASQGGRRISPVLLGVLVFALTVALALFASLGLAEMGLVRNPMLMGLILSTTSLGIVVPVLKQRRLTNSRYGQAVLVSALIADFVTLVLISLVVAIQQRGLTLDVFLVLILLGAFVTALRLGKMFQRFTPLVRVMDELCAATSQIRVRGAFALIVAWVVLAGALGVEIILGAFLAGALIISVLAGQGQPLLREKLDAIGFGFFVPLFFIMVGVGFDLRALLSSPSALLLVPLLVVAAYLVKFLPALLFRLLFSWRQSVAAGALLSSRLSLIIAASAIALELGTISEATNSAIILVAIVTCTLSPMLFMRIAPRLDEEVRRGVVIVGASELSVLLAKRLETDDVPVVVVGRDADRISLVKERGAQAIAGDPVDPRILEQAGAATAEALVSISTIPEVNRKVCEMASGQFGIPTVVARADRPDEVQVLQAMGVRVIQPAMATALALEGALRFPSAFDLLSDKEDEAEIGEATLCNPELDGLLMRRLALSGNALIIGIRRGGEVIVPHGNTVLHMGDLLMLVGNKGSVRDAQEWLERLCDD